MSNKKKILVEVLYLECKKCGIKQEKYKLNDFIYGERLLETFDGLDYAYVNCFEDKTFNNINKLVKKLMKNINDRMVLTNCFNKVFGYICDPINGKRIDASKKDLSFGNCKQETCKIIEKIPPDTKFINIPIITYSKWNKKNYDEKMNYLKKKLIDIGCL